MSAMHCNGPSTFLRFINIFICLFSAVLCVERKKILIVQVSNNNLRTKIDDSGIGDRGEIQVRSLPELSEVSTFLYSQQHGYTYKRLYVQEEVLGENYDEYDFQWVKVHTLYKLLHSESTRHFEYIVITDLDTAFMRPDISLEDKIEAWGGTGASILMPTDPPRNKASYSKYGIIDPETGVKMLIANTGFQIWKNNDISRKYAEYWYNARDGDCIKYRNDDFRDQSCFNDFVRTKFAKGSGIFLPIDCDEANGFPSDDDTTSAWHIPNDWGWGEGDQSNDLCHGRFFAHLWAESKNTERTRLIFTRLIFDGLARAATKSIQEQHTAVALW